MQANKRIFLISACIFLCLFSVRISWSEEIIVQVEGPKGPLEGTLNITKDSKNHLAIIIPGSGPTDRDGNNPLGVNSFTYKYLADELSKKEISSLRIDKRGLNGSQKAIENPNKVTLKDYSDDINKWIDFVKVEKNIQCVWLLGHSEGGLIALLNAKENKNVCGLVLLAAPGRPFAEVLRKQFFDNPANEPILDDALKAIKLLSYWKLEKESIFQSFIQYFRIYSILVSKII